MVLNIIVDSYGSALILAAEIFSARNRIARYSGLNVEVDDERKTSGLHTLDAFPFWGNSLHEKIMQSISC